MLATRQRFGILVEAAHAQNALRSERPLERLEVINTDMLGSDLPCRYSYTARIGKPKGSKNKKTWESLNISAARPSSGERQRYGRMTPIENGGHTVSESTPPFDEATTMLSLY